MSYKNDYEAQLKDNYFRGSNRIFDMDLNPNAVCFFLFLIKSPVTYHPAIETVARGLHIGKDAARAARNLLVSHNMITYKAKKTQNAKEKHYYHINPVSHWKFNAINSKSNGQSLAGPTTPVVEKSATTATSTVSLPPLVVAHIDADNTANEQSKISSRIQIAEFVAKGEDKAAGNTGSSIEIGMVIMPEVFDDKSLCCKQYDFSNHTCIHRLMSSLALKNAEEALVILEGQFEKLDSMKFMIGDGGVASATFDPGAIRQFITEKYGQEVFRRVVSMHGKVSEAKKIKKEHEAYCFEKNRYINQLLKNGVYRPEVVSLLKNEYEEFYEIAQKRNIGEAKDFYLSLLSKFSELPSPLDFKHIYQKFNPSYCSSIWHKSDFEIIAKEEEDKIPKKDQEPVDEAWKLNTDWVNQPYRPQC